MIFIGNDTLLSVNLVRSSVNILDSGGAAEIDVSGSGDGKVGGRVISTSDGFAGVLKSISEGSGYSIDDLHFGFSFIFLLKALLLGLNLSD